MFAFSLCKDVFEELDNDIQEYLLPDDHFDTDFTFGDIIKDCDIAEFDCQFCETCHSGSVGCMIMKFIQYVTKITHK
jgi:hypothetical protein